MAGAHPSEIDLLELVEGDLAATEEASVRAHLETCAACASQVSQLELARDALRAAPLLELPAGRLEEIVATLPERERRRRRLAERFSPRRLALVLVPVAAAATAVIVVTTTGNGGVPEASRSADTAIAMMEEAAPAEAEAADAGAPEVAGAPAQAGAPVASVGETPERTVEILRSAGLDAEATDGGVTVYGATEDEVIGALADVAAGEVQVFLAPPR